MTLSIPDPVARLFQALVPFRQQSQVVTGLLVSELKKREKSLEAACRTANKDAALCREIDEWQSFDDGVQER